MSLKIPFIKTGGNKNKINLFDNDQLDLNFKLKNLSLLSLINEVIESNDQSDLVKASDTKKYYMDLENKNAKKNKKVKKVKNN